MSVTTYTTVNGQILCQSKDGVVSHFVSDPLGSVVMVRDNSGNTVYEAEYDPYGNVQSETGTNPSEFGYVGTLGYVKDSAFSLYVRARYLLTNLGRWLTKDPLWPSEPGFVYAEAGPSMLVDPSGKGLMEAWQAEFNREFDRWVGNAIPPLINPRPFPKPKPLPKPGDWLPHGKYCGQSTDPFLDPCGNPPRFLPEPIDCLDRACRIHDGCLSGLDAFGRSGSFCHCQLAAAAVACALGGCDIANKGGPWGSGGLLGSAVCKAKSLVYIEVFSRLCQVTALR